MFGEDGQRRATPIYLHVFYEYSTLNICGAEKKGIFLCRSGNGCEQQSTLDMWPFIMIYIALWLGRNNV